jgi:hypothetical protein
VSSNNDELRLTGRDIALPRERATSPVATRIRRKRVRGRSGGLRECRASEGEFGRGVTSVRRLLFGLCGRALRIVASRLTPSGPIVTIRETHAGGTIVTGATVQMARTKQLARLSTGGKAPRNELARKAARIPRGEAEEVVVRSLAAHTRNRFLALPEKGSGEYEVAGERIHPVVRGFLKLLGRRAFVQVEDLRILMDDNIEVDPSTPVPTNAAEAQSVAPFEKLRVCHDPEEADEAKAWVILGACRMGRGTNDWERISALSYTATVGSVTISFADFADADPADYGLWAPACKDAAVTIWREFKRCVEKIEAEERKKAQANPSRPISPLISTSALPFGNRLPSSTAVEDVGVSFPVQFSRSHHPELSCLFASLANILADREPELAEELVCLIPSTVSNIHRLGIWVFKNMNSALVRIEHCLPFELRSCSPRDPSNHDPSQLKQKALRRLDWLLLQDAGSFLCTALASDESSAHVVGVDAARRAIFDHEDTRTLPMTKSGFNACCGGGDTCIGLGEVKEVVCRSGASRKRSVTEIE